MISGTQKVSFNLKTSFNQNCLGRRGIAQIPHMDQFRISLKTLKRSVQHLWDLNRYTASQTDRNKDRKIIDIIIITLVYSCSLVGTQLLFLRHALWACDCWFCVLGELLWLILTFLLFLDPDVKKNEKDEILLAHPFVKHETRVHHHLKTRSFAPNAK